MYFIHFSTSKTKSICYGALKQTPGIKFYRAGATPPGFEITGSTTGFYHFYRSITGMFITMMITFIQQITNVCRHQCSGQLTPLLNISVRYIRFTYLPLPNEFHPVVLKVKLSQINSFCPYEQLRTLVPCIKRIKLFCKVYFNIYIST